MSALLIINADDLGYDPAVSEGIVEAMRQGVVTSATFMVNMPHSEAAATMAKGLALGLHFNLTRVKPLSTSFPSTFLKEGLLSEEKASQLPPEVVEAEALAQVARFESLTQKAPTHFDVHKHLHLHPNVLEGLTRAALKTRLPVRSINPEMRAFFQTAGVKTNSHFIGDAGAEAYWTVERLEEQLALLPKEGVIELMCHPGYAPTTVQSGYHQQREVELKTFLSEDAKKLFINVRRGTFSDF